MYLSDILKRGARASGVLSYIYDFVMSAEGAQYGITRAQKVALVKSIHNGYPDVPSEAYWLHYVELIRELCRIPKGIEGDVVECGCYAGGATIPLSIMCGYTGRRLVVCDSFDGLPAPGPFERIAWAKGQYACTLKAVKDNISRYGDISACDFVPGYFKDTLKDLDGEVVMVFEDADLYRSVKDCIYHLWPKMVSGCRFYSHEPYIPHVVGLFYDADIWGDFSEPPGLIGAGKGEHPHGLGYAVKGRPW